MKNAWQRYIPLWIKIGILLILVPLTFFYSIPWAIEQGLFANYGGVDLHAYWYPGHFIRQGVNPYTAIINDPTPDYWNPSIPGSGDPSKQDFNNAPKVPVYYLDGVVVDEQPVARNLITPPAMTAPMTALLGLTAWFSWPVAKEIWLIFNLIFALIVPWLLIMSLPDWRSLHTLDMLIIAFAFYNFYGVRHNIVVGQQSLITLVFLLTALLLMPKHWLLAGIILGIGLSKYSIALPFFLFVLCKREYRVAITSLIVQALAVLALAPLKGGAPWDTIGVYIKTLTLLTSQFGVHIASRFPEGSKFPVFLNAILFVFVIGLFIYWMIRQKNHKLVPNQEYFNSLLFLSAITLLIFLVTYHRIHDTPLMIFYLVSIYMFLIHPKAMRMAHSQKGVVTFFLIVTVAFLIYPTFLGQVSSLLRLPAQISNWLDLPENIITINMLVMLPMTLWLMFSREELQARNY